MNICFLFTTLSEGGIGRVTSIIMNILHEDSDLNIFALLYAPSQKEDIYFLNEDINREYLLKKHVPMKDALISHSIIKKIKKYVKNHNIDVLIACGDLHFPAAVMGTMFSKCKVVCWDHTGPTINSDIKLQRITKSIFTRFSDYNLLLTKAALKTYNERINYKKNFQIYNPIDPEIENQEYTYNHKSHKILSVGRLCYQKNYDCLLDIAKIVLDKHPDWQWHIYGDGVDHDRLIKKCKALNLNDKVIFKGQVNNMYKVYKEYALIVMTSRYEGFPMTLLEASANGLPMIAFDVETGPNEIIQNGLNGFLCEKNNNQEMIDAIEKFIDDDVFRQTASIESYKTCKRFYKEKIYSQWVSMLKNIIK